MAAVVQRLGAVAQLVEEQHIRVEEFVEDDRLVVRAELPGIDPGKDISVMVDRGVLRIRYASRRGWAVSHGRVPVARINRG